MIIIKRYGKKQNFDERKLYASIYAAALNYELSEIKSEKIANQVCKIVKKKIKNNITSNKIRELTIKELKKKNKNIAYLYETHLDIS